jgi:hypothetical protein
VKNWGYARYYGLAIAWSDKKKKLFFNVIGSEEKKINVFIFSNR